MANGDDFVGLYMPNWLKVLLAVLKTQGVAVVISLVLIWFVMHTVAGGLDIIREQMSQAQIEMKAFAVSQEKYDRQRSELLDKQLRIQRQTCASVAKNEYDRKGCWE